MDIEQAREYALSLPGAEESLFAEDWVQYRIEGKWFMLLWLNAPEPRVAVKCDRAIAIELRERYRGIEPAYHMNKRMWNDLYMNRDLEDEDIKKWIKHSYDEVVKKLPKSVRQNISKK